MQRGATIPAASPALAAFIMLRIHSIPILFRHSRVMGKSPLKIDYEYIDSFLDHALHFAAGMVEDVLHSFIVS